MHKRYWVATFMLLASAFCYSNTFADSTATFSVDVDRLVLELTIPEVPAVIDLSPTASGASFGTTTVPIKVATNSAAGYVLTMSVPTTDLVHDTLSSTVIPTLLSTSSEANFPANAWGYKVIGEDYLPVLTSNAPATWTLDGPTNGTDYTLTLAAKVDGTQTSGAYENTLSFNVVTIPNALRDTIIYNGNGADSGSMTNQLVYQGEPSKLNSNGFTRYGYLFNGWNTSSNGLGVGYGDEGEYTPTISDSTKTTTLYAQWICDSSVNTCEGVPSIDGSSGAAGRTLQAAYEQAYVNNPGQFPKDEGGYKHGLYVPHKNAQGEYDGTYFEATQQSDYDGIPAKDLRFAIQDIDLKVDGQSVCERATVIGSEAYVLDLRDYKSYWVAKLKDGKCWMTQNLDFDIDSTRTYTSADTDLGWNGTSYTYTEWKPDSSTKKPSDGWTSTNVVPYSWDVGDKYFWGIGSYTACNYLVAECDTTKSTPDPDKGAHSHVGNYYNWTASVALNNSSSYTSNGIADPSTNPNTSICPKGWRLLEAESTSNVEISVLLQAYNIKTPGAARKRTEAPLYFAYAGAATDSILYGGYKGFYRMLEARTASAAWYFEFQVGANMYFGSWSRANGISVRCVAR